jgi:hypothetical protein
MVVWFLILRKGMEVCLSLLESSFRMGAPLSILSCFFFVGKDSIPYSKAAASYID